MNPLLNPFLQTLILLGKNETKGDELDYTGFSLVKPNKNKLFKGRCSNPIT
jgi:hypothetical protein